MKDFKAIAKEFVAKVAAEGFTYSISESGSVVSVYKSFPKGNMDEFIQCDMIAPFLLMIVPSSGGSVWGTDGGSVGGYSAVVNGNFCLNKSGVKKRFISQLRKLQL